MIRKIALTLCFFITLIICSGICFADLKVFIDKREVEINKTLLLTIEVDKDVTSVELPKMPDFVVMLKEKYKKKNVRVFEYEVAPKSVGFFTIPAITVGGSSSIPMSIKVYEKEKEENKISNKDSSSLAQAFTDTKIVYTNQLIFYTLSFRTKKSLSANPTYVLPMFQNFWKDKSKTVSDYKLIDGENYFTFTVVTSLYPMTEGEIVIDPSSVSVQYLGFDSVKKFETNKVKIKVLPLPSLGKPENFSGAVGRYNISATINKKSIKVNEPLVVTITISGNGDINSVSEPKIDLPNEIQKYATTVKINKEGIINSKQFQCVLMPILEGDFTIPKISFSYFNPDSKEYATINTSEFKIKVSGKKQEQNENIHEIVDASNDDLKKVDDGFVLQKNVDLTECSSCFITNKFFITLIILIVLLVILAILYRIRLYFIYKDVVKVQKMKARNEFVKCMSKAKTALKYEKQFDFCFYIDIALKMLLKSKNNYEYCSMIKDEIICNLKALSFDDDMINKIISILNNCDKFKFTSIKISRLDMQKMYTEVDFIKEEMDKVIL